LTSLYANKHFYLVSFIHFLSVLQYEYNYEPESINDQMAPLISRHIHASIAVEDPGTCAAILAAVQHLRKQLGRVFALRMPHDHTPHNTVTIALQVRGHALAPALEAAAALAARAAATLGGGGRSTLRWSTVLTTPTATTQPLSSLTTGHRVNL
jgi:hypothetical protein